MTEPSAPVGRPSRISGTEAGDAEYKVGPGKPPLETRFQPGNPGRQPGSRNKLQAKFYEDLYAKWQEHGVKAIESMIVDKPGDFVKVVASVLPKEMNVNVNQFAEMSDDELIARIRQLDALVRPFLDPSGIRGSDGRVEPSSVN